MLEVFESEQGDSSAVAYFDGLDARLYRAFTEKLGSEERVQNAMILLGLMKKLKELKNADSSQEVARAEGAFQEYVGISFEKFDKLLQSCSSIV